MKSIKKYCCEEMEKKINYKCSKHNDPFDCPDNLLFYNKKYKEFGIIVHDDRVIIGASQKKPSKIKGLQMILSYYFLQ